MNHLDETVRWEIENLTNTHNVLRKALFYGTNVDISSVLFVLDTCFYTFGEHMKRIFGDFKVEEIPTYEVERKKFNRENVLEACRKTRKMIDALLSAREDIAFFGYVEEDARENLEEAYCEYAKAIHGLILGKGQ